MTTQDVEAITPQTLINIRPAVAAIKEFYFGTGRSTVLDQVNPLSGLTHAPRGGPERPGGVSEPGSRSATSASPHYGRMCPMETPEGPTSA